jgi:hypothetical protein
MKNCPKCSSSVDDLAKFCPKCGASTSSKDSAIAAGKSKLPPAPPPVRKKTVPVVEKQVALDQNAAVNIPPAKTQFFNSTRLFWIIIIAIGYGIFKSYSSDEAPVAPVEVAAPPPPSPVVPSDGLGGKKELVPESKAPHGYAAIYLTDDISGWGIGTGYQTQEEADAATLKNCEDRNPGKSCSKKIGGPYKCGAVGVSAAWWEWSLGNDVKSLHESILTGCKSNGGDCEIKPDGQVCSTW